MVLKSLEPAFLSITATIGSPLLASLSIISMVALPTLVCSPVTTLAIVDIPSPIGNMLLVTARIGLGVSIFVSAILILNVFSLGVSTISKRADAFCFIFSSR